MSVLVPTAPLPEALVDRRIGAPRSRVRGLVRRISRSGPTTVAALLLILIVLAAVAAPALAPYSPLDMHSLVLYAARISLTVSVTAETLAILLGVPLGVLAGYRGGVTDDVIMRALDGFLAFPGILLALTIVGMFGPH